MNEVASYLAYRKELQRSVQNEDFYKQKGMTQEVTNKEWVVSGQIN